MSEPRMDIFGSDAGMAFDALNQSGCGAMIASNEGKIVYVNPKFCEMTGYNKSELIGRNPKMLQSGNTPRETYLVLWNTVSSGRPWRGLLQNKRKNGDLYWEAITISPLKDSSGAITHFSAIVSEVTDEKIAESEQNELNEEIFQSEKRESLNAFALGLAHDLNNSLTGITAACGLARKNLLDPIRIGEMLDLIEGSAIKSSQFLSQAAALWRPVLPNNISIDLAKTLAHHAVHYQLLAGKQVFQLLNSDEPAPVKASAALIHEAVSALLENAREASSGGAITIRTGVLTRLEPQTEEHFISCGLESLSVTYVEVEDSGMGMDDYTLRRAFNPFFTTKAGHKGIGLAKVYGIMAAHKGAIGVITVPGKGTRMRLYFRRYGV